MQKKVCLESNTKSNVCPKCCNMIWWKQITCMHQQTFAILFGAFMVQELGPQYQKKVCVESCIKSNISSKCCNIIGWKPITCMHRQTFAILFGAFMVLELEPQFRKKVCLESNTKSNVCPKCCNMIGWKSITCMHRQSFAILFGSFMVQELRPQCRKSLFGIKHKVKCMS